MTALDKIRLIGLLRRGPANGGASLRSELIGRPVIGRSADRPAAVGNGLERLSAEPVELPVVEQ